MLEDFRGTAAKAYASVDVPESVIDVLVGLRTYLQDKCEPPVYVSDRRFMKAVKMLQVAAYADGRDAVNEFDCLLLEFVLGRRPTMPTRSRPMSWKPSRPTLGCSKRSWCSWACLAGPAACWRGRVIRNWRIPVLSVLPWWSCSSCGTAA